MPASDQNLVWIDLEMTGLDPDRCHILEIATIVTDSHLHVLAEGPALTLHADTQIEATLSDWSREHFTKSGLLERARASRIDRRAAEILTLDFLHEWCTPRSAPLCGNSIHNDRAFLTRHMPALIQFLHYRIVDVSSFKEMIRRWHPADFAPPKKAELHEALADIRESIEELRYYRNRFIAPRSAHP